MPIHAGPSTILCNNTASVYMYVCEWLSLYCATTSLAGLHKEMYSKQDVLQYKMWCYDDVWL